MKLNFGMDLVRNLLSSFCVLTLLLIYTDCCEDQNACNCTVVQGTLFADCSNLGLNKSPVFWPNVTNINLSHNKLTYLPLESTLPSNLTFLDLSYNEIKHILNKTFKGLWKLSDLRLNGNKLGVPVNLDRNAFADLENIKHLDLSNNPELTFRIMPILTYGLRNSPIEILRLNKIHCTFGPSTELRVNDLRYLKNTTLKELHISSNRLEIVEERAVGYLPQTIKRVSIADNNLTFGLYLLELFFLKNLEWINASMQHMSHNPREVLKSFFFFSCNNKRRDNSEELNFETANKPLRYLTNFQKQEFSSARMNYTFPVPYNLKTLFMNESGLGYSIPEIRFTRNNIENLYTQGNSLRSWIGPVRSLENLKRLDMSNNFCTSVSDYFFQHLNSIVELYLNNNLLGFSLASDREGKIFRYLNTLSHLELKGNKIASLPTAVFVNLTNLKYLDLSNNLLTSIDFNISHLKSLTYLNLSSNQIQYLSDSTMDAFDQHSNQAPITLSFSNNPFLCECKTLKFLHWMDQEKNSSKIHLNNFNEYTCRKEGKLIKFVDIQQHIKELEKECASYRTLIFVVTSCILLFLFILTTGLVYRYRWRLRYFYYMTKSRYHGYKSVRGEDEQTDFKYDAFVSYADKDLRFVQQMTSKLEGEKGIRLCIHHRDFVPGYDIAENIITAINKSRKTILILSPNFIESEWCMYELRIAKMEEIYNRDNENVLFLICYEEIPAPKIPLSIMDVIHQKSYLEFPNDEYGNTVFWDKLHAAIV